MVEYEDVSAGYDSQDDPDTSYDKFMSRFERHIQANNARYPCLVGKVDRSLLHSRADDDIGAVVDPVITN